MTLDAILRDHLEASGESMRALSLRAGLNPKAVSDILNIPGLRPRHSTLEALSKVTGRDLFSASTTPKITYAELISAAQQRQDKSVVSRLRWLCRNAQWAPELKLACKQDVIDFFDNNEATRFDLTAASYATYRSQLVRAVASTEPRNRKRGIADIGGTYAEAHRAIENSDVPRSLRFASGAFLLFLHDNGIQPAEITTATLGEYFNCRVAGSSKSVTSCEKHVREIASLLKQLAGDPALSKFGFQAVSHPFEDGRDKFGVDAVAIEPLMVEFDANVAPWALGKATADGLTFGQFIAQLDACEAAEPVNDRVALLRARRKAKAGMPGQDRKSEKEGHKERLRDAGFLVGKHVWSANTLKVRRGYVVSLAKAVAASTDLVPNDLEELTNPEFLDAGAECLRELNEGEFPSAYVGSVLKTARKIAASFQRRCPDDLAKIDDLIAEYEVKHSGIAPRNKAKLRQFNDKRIQSTIDLAADLTDDVNREIGRRRQSLRRKNGVLPRPVDVIDAELGRDVMAALAHSILLARAPRSDNVLRARLDWISWGEHGARITVPAVQVKMRKAGDADLTIQLGNPATALLRQYLDVVRPRLLAPCQAHNPYLFPAQSGKDLSGYYSSLLSRVTRVLHRKIGVRIHPHLYRHLIGWIWLRESSDNLPKVQKLLGHANLQTTVDYYVELDEGLISDEWQNMLENKTRNSSTRKANHK